MGRSGKKTVLVVMLMLPPLLSACHQRTSPDLADPTLRHGRAIFKLWCSQCHVVVRNDERVAPDLSGVGLRLSPQTMAQMIQNPSVFYPGTIMPPYEHLSALDSRVLLHYLSSLKDSGEQKDAMSRMLQRCEAALAKLRNFVTGGS